ncbi:hypothetical protein BaRGS_00018615, partial [Batillaria attramentaria]
YRQELKVVRKELKEVEQELQELLTRQSHLVDRRSQLEALLQNHETQALQQADTQWDRTDFPWSKKLPRLPALSFQNGVTTANAAADHECYFV